jgi:dGTPase
MAHDLGHPPFGHVGEAALQLIVSDTPNEIQAGVAAGSRTISPPVPIDTGYHLTDSFEGNAQTFRIVTRLSFGSYASGDGTHLGLNLTKASLSALSKYPWTRSHTPDGVDRSKNKWGAYDADADILEWCMEGIRGTEPRVGRTGRFEYRSIEAQAMDWADDITYAVHDLEDFCRAGLIPLDDLTSSVEGPAVADFWRYCKPRLLKDAYVSHLVSEGRLNLEECFNKVRRDLKGAQGAGLPGRRGRELLREWAVNRIEHWTGPSTISVDSKNGLIDIDEISLIDVEILKKLTWFFVIDRPALASAQRGQVKVLRELFSWLVSWAGESYPGLEEKAKVFGQVRRQNYTHGGLPARYLDFLDIAFSFESYPEPRKNVARATLDYIASLTERQVLDLHSRLSGAAQAPMLDGWFTV